MKENYEVPLSLPGILSITVLILVLIINLNVAYNLYQFTADYKREYGKDFVFIHSLLWGGIGLFLGIIVAPIVFILMNIELLCRR
jgi:hypothetical protein|tara:strand:- start:803 stop:1057 length:255 start_codon:yes stop_codon:yes gene_type:complete